MNTADMTCACVRSADTLPDDDVIAARRVAEAAAREGLTLVNVGDQRFKLMDARRRAMIAEGDGDGLSLSAIHALLRTRSGPSP